MAEDREPGRLKSPWPANQSIPRCVAALLESLSFAAGPQQLPVFSEPEWKAALYFFDRNQLTLLLRLPVSVHDANLAKNQERARRMKQAFADVSAALAAANIEFAVLKGFANWEHFTPDPHLRMQYDLDLFCPQAAAAARDTLIRSLGYEPLPGAGQFPTDHLPALVHKTGWQWQGDFFDPDIPISVELHFRLWDESTEGFAAPGVEEFWSRRVEQNLDGRPYLALDPVDAPGYCALHLLRHLLRGELRASNIYEIAWFLDQNAANDAFWARWRDLHCPALRRLEAICFRLAAAWFDCRVSRIAQAEIDLLPAPIQRWFAHCAFSPAEAFFRPNKDELWLHLCLLDSFRKKATVLRRRLFPTRLPGPLDSVFIPEQRMTWSVRLRKRWQYAHYVASRAIFHVRAILPTLARMVMTRS
jgi:Uncharacterised nucleotidyltransferase